MAKFSNAKVGQDVWSSVYGWGEIKEVYHGSIYKLKVTFDDGYRTIETYFTVEGKHNIEDKYCTLFWNEFTIPDENEKEESFDLVEFLQLNVSYVEHDTSANNYFIHYDYMDNYFTYSCSSIQEYIGVVYLDSSDFEYVISILNEHNVTPSQLKEAYCELGWL